MIVVRLFSTFFVEIDPLFRRSFSVRSFVSQIPLLLPLSSLRLFRLSLLLHHQSSVQWPHPDFSVVVVVRRLPIVCSARARGGGGLAGVETALVGGVLQPREGGREGGVDTQ